MGVNVSRPHPLQKIFVGPSLTRPKINHDRDTRERPAFDSAIDSSPGHMLGVPREGRPVVGSFYSNDDVAIPRYCRSANSGIHLIQTALQTTVHSIGHDIQKGQYADSSPVDYLLLLLKESLSTGSACVDNRGDAGLQRHICGNAEGERVRARLGSEPVQWRPPMADVIVNIDQTGRHVQVRNIHDLAGLIRRNTLLDRRNFALEYGYISH